MISKSSDNEEEEKIISVNVDELIFDVDSELIKKKYNSNEIVKVSISIIITNNSENNVFIKINTNKQNLYICNPSRKIMKANENITINIILMVKFKYLKKEISDIHKFRILAYIVENDENINESNISGMLKTTQKKPNQKIKLTSKFIYNSNNMKKEEVKQKKGTSEISSDTENKKTEIKSLKIEIRELMTRYNDLKFENSNLEAKINDLTKNQILSIKLELNKDKLEHVEKIPGILVVFLCFIAFIFGYLLTS